MIILKFHWNLKTYRRKLLFKKLTFNRNYQEASYLVGVTNAEERKSYVMEDNLTVLACKIIMSKILEQVAVCKI